MRPVILGEVAGRQAKRAGSCRALDRTKAASVD